MPVFDVAVVGGGVAGLNAAAASASAGLSCVLIDAVGGGGELMNLGVIRACPDLPPGTTGPDLAADLLGTAMEAGVELAFGTVTGMERRDAWLLRTGDAEFEARAVVLASGLGRGRLGVPDEARYEGVGLSHCAACDGPLFRGLSVAVAGSDRWAIQEAEDLAAACASVTLITQAAGGTGAKVMDATTDGVPGIRIVDGRVVGLAGAPALDEVVVKRDGGTVSVPAQGLFVQCGRTPALGYAPPDLAVEPDGRPRAGAGPESSLPLVFVAGSVRTGAEATIPEASADGRSAASAVVAALRGG